MLRGLFVTGTGTGVGKTVVSAAILRRYRSLHPRYWKPIQTGIEQDDDTAEVVRLSAGNVLERGVRLPRPLSPHLAAKLHGTRIDLPRLMDVVRSQPDSAWVVEGAGGVLVPIDESNLMADWMRMLGLPTLVVASAELGTINHTLLTLEALRSRGIPVAGVVMTGEDRCGNRDAIEDYGRVRVRAAVPHFASLGGSEWERWTEEMFDQTGQLMGYFT